MAIKNNIDNYKKKVKEISPFVLIKHDYIMAQLIPTKSSKTTEPERIFNEINKMYNKVLSIENKKIIINQPYKVSFYTQVKNNSINFYLIYPKEYKSKIEIIINSMWRGIEIKYLDEFPIDLDEFSKKQITYKNKDILSVNNDKKDKFLLNSLASISSSLYDENDEIGILYNFIPTTQKESNYFRNDVYKKEIARYERGLNLSKTLNISQSIEEFTKQSIVFVEETINCVFGNDDKKSETFISIPNKPSPATRKKANCNLCKTQIVAFTKASSKDDEERLFLEIDKAFDIVSGDNKLITKKINNEKIALSSPLITGVTTNKTSINECLNFLKMPNRGMLKMYNEKIEHNETIELQIPDCLLNGNRLIGLTKINGKETPVYYSTDEQIQRAEIVVLGPKGAGKTWLTTNMAINSMNIGRGVVIIEIIEDCPMCKQILEEYRKGRIKRNLINIDCRDYNNIPALCYNEIEMWEGMPDELKVDRAIQRGQQLQEFLNSINAEDASLKPRMIKYFFAACAVVYCVNIYASFYNIMECLTDVDKREEYIESLTPELRELLDSRIKILNELTKEGSKGSLKNDDNKIEGILNREALFSSVSYQAEKISQKTSENNIDFKKALQDNSIILIQLPEQLFTNSSIKNTMATFFLSKIWNAKKQLSTNKDKQPTELYFDEFYKCPNATKIFEDIFVEGRKFNLTSVVTIHTLDELSRNCCSRLISGGVNYLLLYGTNADDFRRLKTYMDNSIEYEDLEDMPRYHGICIIKNKDKNYSSFIARFPENFMEEIKKEKS